MKTVFSLLLAAACLKSVLPQALPEHSRPTAYHLNIDASNLENSTTFRGSVVISVDMITNSNNFTLHSEGLVIKDPVAVERNSKFGGWKPMGVYPVTYNDSLLVIPLQTPGVSGEFRIRVDYQGDFANRMAGFAKVGYHYNRNMTYMAVTNLNPTNARSVFPCFDIPDYRTKFSLNITVDNSMTVLSNVDQTSVHNATNTTRTFVFDRYPELPIHALGWAVIHNNHFMQKILNIATTPVYTHATYPYSTHTAWANNMSVGLLAALESYTGQNFSLSRLEQIVVPEFFTGSAEGWGIISYSEEAILVSPGKSSARYTQQAALEIARGLVHQWFGGLVSMKSWHDSWLTTGLTEYLKFVITGSLANTSDWELTEQIVVELVQPALALDVSGHALMDNTQNETEEVREACDDLTKYKGGAIMFMLSNILGNEVFKSALRVYLSTKRGGVSEPEDLWNLQYEAAMDENIELNHQSVNTIMAEWTSTAGYPTLNVTWNGTHFNISQPTSGQWHIPVTYMLQKTPGVMVKKWLQPKVSIAIPASEPQWILVNVNQTGFYRVNYDTALRNLLLNQLNSDLTHIPRLSRAQLIDDLFALAYSERLSYGMVLEFTRYLKAETDYYPWRTALTHFQALMDKMYGYTSYEMLRTYVLNLLPNVMTSVSGTPKSHTDKLKQALILENACSLKNTSCIQRSVNILNRWMSSTTEFDVNLSTSLLCSGVANSSVHVWRRVWSMFQHSMFPSVRSSLLRALVCTRNSQLLKEFLTNITSPNHMLVSPKDKTILLKTLASTSSGAELLLDWLLERLYIQVNTTSSESAPTSGTASTAPVALNTTGSKDNTTGLIVSSDQSGLVTDNSITSATVPEKLSDNDVIATLIYVLPKLTTSSQAFKLSSFLAQNVTGISIDIVDLMKNATKQVNAQAGWSNKTNDGIASWLETNTSGHGDTSTKGPGSLTIPTTAPGKSVATSVLSSVMLCILVTVLPITLF